MNTFCAICFFGFTIFQMTDSAPSIIKDNRVELPGSEKINKRSIDTFHVEEDVPYPPVIVPNTNIKRDDKEELETAESGLVFLPLFRSKNQQEFRRRNRRSNIVETDDDLEGVKGLIKPLYYHNVRLERSATEDNPKSDDLEVNESGLVFRPLFRSRQRDTRSAEDKDDLSVSETGLVFLPVFRNGQRNVRSIQNKDDMDEDLQVAENGLVFRPLFRTRQRNSRSVGNQARDEEDLETSENGLVFRPVFRTKQRNPIPE